MFRRRNGDDNLKVITALGNPIINEKLKEYDKYEIVGKDIQYEEGIFEILEENNNIDILLVSNNLPEEYDFKILINKIIKIKNNLKIIVFLKEKDETIENFLISKNIFEIYYMSNIEEFFYKININNEMKHDDIEEIKKLINNNIKKIENYDNKNTTKKKKKRNIMLNRTIKEDYADNEKKEIIVITGNNGAGKSIISAIFSDFLIKHNKKVLLIDMDFNYSTISSLFDKKNKKNNDLIVNIKSNFDIIFDLKKYLFQSNFNYEFIYKELSKFRIIYDSIIIDLPGDKEKEMVKEMLQLSDKIIYLFEPNLIELQKANLNLESYINDLKIDSNKIKLILNKSNKYKIDKNILTSVFSEYEIIGDVEYSEMLNLVINKMVINELAVNFFEKTFQNIRI